MPINVDDKVVIIVSGSLKDDNEEVETEMEAGTMGRVGKMHRENVVLVRFEGVVNVSYWLDEAQQERALRKMKGLSPAVKTSRSTRWSATRARCTAGSVAMGSRRPAGTGCSCR